MMSRVIGGLALALAVCPPASLTAQPRGGDGYLFHRPPALFSLRIGANQPSASSDIFQSFHKDLTLGRRDYLAPSYAVDMAFPLSPRAEIQISASVSRRRSHSEFRDFVDNNDLPIEQATEFYRVPLSVGIKWNMVSSGRQIGQLAWIPSRFVPYVSAGAGMSRYSLRQDGDFVDFKTMRVFPSLLKASGWGALAYGALGTTVNINSWMGYTTELRYDMSRAPLHGDYQDFNNISLSGVGLTTGLTFRF